MHLYLDRTIHRFALSARITKKLNEIYNSTIVANLGYEISLVPSYVNSVQVYTCSNTSACMCAKETYMGEFSLLTGVVIGNGTVKDPV